MLQAISALTNALSAFVCMHLTAASCSARMYACSCMMTSVTITYDIDIGLCSIAYMYVNQVQLDCQVDTVVLCKKWNWILQCIAMAVSRMSDCLMKKFWWEMLVLTALLSTACHPWVAMHVYIWVHPYMCIPIHVHTACIPQHQLKGSTIRSCNFRGVLGPKESGPWQHLDVGLLPQLHCYIG